MFSSDNPIERLIQGRAKRLGISYEQAKNQLVMAASLDDDEKIMESESKLVIVDGILVEYVEREMWGIFVYRPDEDVHNIKGQAPLYYDTYEQLKKEWETTLLSERKEWDSHGHKVAIRPIKVMDRKDGRRRVPVPK